MNTREAQGLDEDTQTANWIEACYQSFEESKDSLDFDSCRACIQDAKSKHLDDLVARMEIEMLEAIKSDEAVNG